MRDARRVVSSDNSFAQQRGGMRIKIAGMRAGRIDCNNKIFEAEM